MQLFLCWPDSLAVTHFILQNIVFIGERNPHVDRTIDFLALVAVTLKDPPPLKHEPDEYRENLIETKPLGILPSVLFKRMLKVI